MSENQYIETLRQSLQSNMVVPVAGTGPAQGIGDVSLAFVSWTPLGFGGPCKQTPRIGPQCNTIKSAS